MKLKATGCDTGCEHPVHEESGIINIKNTARQWALLNQNIELWAQLMKWSPPRYDAPRMARIAANPRPPSDKWGNEKRGALRPFAAIMSQSSAGKQKVRPRDIKAESWSWSAYPSHSSTQPAGRDSQVTIRSCTPGYLGRACPNPSSVSRT